MKRQLALVLVPALLALVSFNAWASDGDILMVSQVVGTGGGHTGDECTFWKIVFNNSSPNGKSPWGVCQPPVIKVYAELKGASANGISGVEYAGTYGPTNAADPGYFFIEVPAPATTVLGNAFFPPDPAPRGQNMVWDTCQTGGSAGRVLLATLIVIPTTPCGSAAVPGEIHLAGGRHNDPSNPLFRCPLFTVCDAPVFTKVCLGDNLTLCPAPIIPGCGTPGRPPCPNVATCSTSGSFAINDPTSPGVGACSPAPGKTGPSAAVASEATWSHMKALYR
jgi:hypothetical protein